MKSEEVKEKILKLKKRSKKKERQQFRFMRLRKLDEKHNRCIICETIGMKIKPSIESYKCLLFGGEPICAECCHYEIDAGRNEGSVLDVVRKISRLDETEIYAKCMKCQHSSKMGMYNVFSELESLMCYFGEKAQDVPKKRGGRRRSYIKCKIFNNECKYQGNSKECEHGAWSNEALVLFKHFIEQELILRGIDPETDLDDIILGDDDDE